MKAYIFAIAVLIAFSSCKMHVFLVKSDASIKSDTAFVFENDTMKVTYDLWEDKGKMHFSIYNKLSVPLFIDWKNSSLMKNGVPVPYWMDQPINKLPGGGVAHKDASSKGAADAPVHDYRVKMLLPHSETSKDSKASLSKSEKPKKSESHLRFRNHISYSLNEDLHNQGSVDVGFEVTKVKAIKKKQMETFKSPKSFYTSK